MISNQCASEYSAQTRAQLTQILQKHLAFHLISWLLALLTGSTLFSLAFFYPPSLLMAGGLSLFFFELFAYAILSFYLVEKKKAQLIEIGRAYLYRISQNNEGDKSTAEIGRRLQDLSHQFHDVHWCLIKEGKLPALRRLASGLPAWWLNGDVRAMREWLLLAAADCQIKGVCKSPLDLDPHAQLAMTCIDLADLSIEPKETGNGQEPLADNVKMFLQVALEEFMILTEIGMPTPELYQKMASCHCRLGDREKQAENFQRAIKLDPERSDLRFQLGKLYFALGQQRKGLEVAAYFKEKSDARADALLQHYGAQRVFSLDSTLETFR